MEQKDKGEINLKTEGDSCDDIMIYMCNFITVGFV